MTAHQVLTNEKAETAMASGAQVICISDISRHDAPRARFLGRRLRTRGCTAFVVTGLWRLDDDTSNLAALAERFSADQAATNLLLAAQRPARLGRGAIRAGRHAGTGERGARSRVTSASRRMQSGGRERGKWVV